MLLIYLLAAFDTAVLAADQMRPNILIAISDDQSFPHTSIYGDKAYKTPSMQRVADAGVIFTNAYVPSPGCSPSRAAFLTGLNTWQIGAAGTHASTFPTEFISFQDRLEKAGYSVGFTGKGWGPGDWATSGRIRNPAGTEYNQLSMKVPEKIKPVDYAGNFENFLAQRKPGQPFSFWYGGHEPHRQYKPGIGRENGIDPADMKVPAFLPDNEQVRSDLADYAYEIQWFDQHLGRMLDTLQAAGELENTVVIVTSDNGMPFPRAKANAYDYGIHVPLAIAWPVAFEGRRSIEDLVSLLDVTATIYQAAGTGAPASPTPAGSSLLDVLRSGQQGEVESERVVFCARERHTSARYLTKGYPQRCVRKGDYLYIHNFHAERWPAGAPSQLLHPGWDVASQSVIGTEGGPGYLDIDNSPTLKYLVAESSASESSKYLQLAIGHRPIAELFDVRNDPECLHNLATDPAMAGLLGQMQSLLLDYLKSTGDPRVLAMDGGESWENYPRLSGAIRWFLRPDWADQFILPEHWPPWLRAERPD